MKWLRLALRHLARDWRSGELSVVGLALVIAVAGVSSVGFIADRMEAAMADQAARFIGADIAVRGPNPLPEAWLTEARARGLRTSRSVEFATMAVAGEAMQLVSAKAVEDSYPLRGRLKTSASPFGEEQAAASGPKPGEVWLESRLFGLLNLKPGDSLEIGAARFRVSAVLGRDPGEGGDMFNVAPHVLFNLADLAKTEVVQPGSRVGYRLLFAGDEAVRDDFQAWLKPRLNPAVRMIGGRDGSPALGNALERADSYLSLAALISVVLAGVAIAMAAQRYAQRHYDMSALLRCFGAKRANVLGLFALVLLLLGALASLAGVGLGFLAHLGLAEVLKTRLPEGLPAPGWKPVTVGLTTGILLLLGFALPALLRLQRVPPLRVLKRDLDPVAASTWSVYLLAFLTLAGLMFWHSGSWRLTGVVLAGGALACVLMGVASLGLLRLTRRLSRGWSLAARFGIAHLQRHRRESLVQILAFGMTLTVMLAILMVRIDLLSAWQAQLPPDAPNHFLVNIQPDEVEPVRHFFREHGIGAEALYPMVRGRLVAKNGRPIVEVVPDAAKDDNALRRELNLSWSRDMPSDNQILAGRWWQAGDTSQAKISVESMLAERFGFKLGDRLRFQIGDQSVEATIASLRKVQWDSFHPNFYVMFPPGIIDHYPSAWITSFYLPPADKPVLNQLVRQFPGQTLIEVDQLMAEVKAILTQVTLAVEYLLIFVLVAGFAVLAACLQATMDERLFEAVILRTLGSSRGFLRRALATEFLVLGGLAGLLAAVAAEAIAYGLYTRIFRLDPALHPWFWLLGPVAGMLCIGLGGSLSGRRIAREPPLKSLRSI